MKKKGQITLDFLPLSFISLLCFGYYGMKSQGHPFLPFAVIATLQFAAFLWMWSRFAMGRIAPLSLVLGAAIVARVILWPTDPILEKDFWRYLWDGRVFAHGINPFLYPPLDPALDHLDVFYRSKIHWEQFRTIYPPTSQYVFALSHLIYPDSVIGLKFILSLFDFGTGLLLVSWLPRLRIHPSWSALYLLNPLILKEFANSGHLDSIAVFLTTLAIYLATQYRNLLATFVLAVATGAKLFPIVLFPFFFKLARSKILSVFVFIGVLFLLYFPFLEAGSALFASTGVFGKHWIFNAGAVKLLNLLLDPWFEGDWSKYHYPTKVLIAILMGSLLLWLFLKLKKPKELPRTSFILLGAVLIFSPVVNAWYVSWVLPLAVLFRSVPWMSFSFLVLGAYSYFYSVSFFQIYRWVEWGLFLGIFLWVQHQKKEFPFSRSRLFLRP